MFLKMAGCLLILSASSLLGHLVAQTFSRRPEELRTMQSMLNRLENEIKFMSNLLSESFRRICTENSVVADIFLDAAGFMDTGERVTAQKAWEMSIKNNIKKTAFDKEDEKILLDFGQMLGVSDLEGQLKNIRFTLRQLEIQEKKAEEARRKNETMYRRLGVLGGLALIILLI